jgi:hypothetical protein
MEAWTGVVVMEAWTGVVVMEAWQPLPSFAQHHLLLTTVQAALPWILVSQLKGLSTGRAAAEQPLCACLQHQDILSGLHAAGVSDSQS